MIVETIKELILEAMTSEGNQFLGAGLILGAITTGALTLKMWLKWCIDRFQREFTYSIYIDNSSSMYSAVSDWYYHNFPHKFRSVEVSTEWREESGERNIMIKRRQFRDFNFLFYDNRLLFVRKGKSISENPLSIEARSLDYYEIYGLFAKKAINKIVEESYKHYKEYEKGLSGIKLIHSDGYGNQERAVMVDFKDMSTIFSPAVDIVVKDIDAFISGRELYKQRGMRYKRSYLLKGQGGTGKTSLVLAVADKYQRRVYFVNPAKFNDDNGYDRFIRTIEPNSIVLFEDIDIFFTDRERPLEERTTKVSFHAFMNSLDGATSPTDVLIFLTTNHPEKLDPALVRKGRVDVDVLMDLPRKEDMEGYLSMFYAEEIRLETYKPITIASLQELCLSLPKDQVMSALS